MLATAYCWAILSVSLVVALVETQMTCPPGTYLSESIGRCMWCEAGTYQTDYGSASCITCKRGMVSQESAASSPSACRNCNVGSYALNSTTCAPCPLNTISPAGAVDILECTSIKGHYSTPRGVGVECPANFYCVQGTTAPTPCPDGTISLPGAWGCTPGVRSVILFDWVFGSVWIILFLSGAMAIWTYKKILIGAPQRKQTLNVIKIEIVR